MHTVRQAIYHETERLGIECTHVGELYDAYTVGGALLTVTAATITVDRTVRTACGVTDITETHRPDPDCAAEVLRGILDAHDRTHRVERTGEDIRRTRESAGITQADLAAELGVDRTTIGAWERSGHLQPWQAMACLAALGRML